MRVLHAAGNGVNTFMLREEEQAVTLRFLYFAVKESKKLRSFACSRTIDTAEKGALLD